MPIEKYFYDTPMSAEVLGEEYFVEYQEKEEAFASPGLPVYRIKNFSISSGKGGASIRVSGQTVVLAITSGGLWGYFHLIHLSLIHI